VTDTDEPILETIDVSKPWTPSAMYRDRLERAGELAEAASGASPHRRRPGAPVAGRECGRSRRVAAARRRRDNLAAAIQREHHSMDTDTVAALGRIESCWRRHPGTGGFRRGGADAARARGRGGAQQSGAFAWRGDHCRDRERRRPRGYGGCRVALPGHGLRMQPWQRHQSRHRPPWQSRHWRRGLRAP
jgi:hypothetical protein